ncbi:ubiquitin family proteint [Coprinopsis marcescibilis]|uniref:protein-serine/threonine phosphatase n=1 Tax=Coprinopsis marcescibilis TaxID=230819 RepID=A0A5C3LDS0_COPMA|nr:ubiquitin family proteint [Coprinopsis marcescibilis]
MSSAQEVPVHGDDLSESSLGPATMSTEEPQDRWVDLQFGWAGKTFHLRIAETDRVYDLKTSIRDLTTVPIERQKILGLVKGKLPPDQACIADLRLGSAKKFSLIGTPQGDEIKDPSQLENLPDVINDLDVDFTENLAAVNRYRHDHRNIRKIREMTENLQVNIITPLRPGKKLLVLDIDYTIVDTKPLTSGSLPPDECARPYLHEFLTALYPYYDVCIWSQTSWIWLETKLVELGMVGANRNYQISFVLDKKCMFTIFSEREGKPWSHHVKALQIIWNHFPQFNASNTVHIDDLSRNFALNPKEGIKISAYKNAHTAEARADRELVKLTRYLLHVANVEDFRTLKHKEWKSVVGRLPPPA